MTSEVTFPETREAPFARAADESHMTSLRAEISVNENKLADAIGSIGLAETEIATIEKRLAGWKRWLRYQQQRRDMLANRIRTDRAQLRMEEDFASGLEP